MIKTNIISIGIAFFLVITVNANPLISYESGLTGDYASLNNYWWENSMPTSIKQNYMSSAAGFAGHKNTLNEQVQITTTINRINFGDTKHIWVKSQNEGWNYKPKLSNGNRVSTMNISTSSGYEAYAGSSSNSNVLPTLFLVNSSWLDRGIAENVQYRTVNSSNNNMPISDNVTSNIPVAPAPASILLGTIGIAIVGFLKNRKMFLKK